VEEPSQECPVVLIGLGKLSQLGNTMSGDELSLVQGVCKVGIFEQVLQGCLRYAVPASAGTFEFSHAEILLEYPPKSPRLIAASKSLALGSQARTFPGSNNSRIKTMSNRAVGVFGDFITCLTFQSYCPRPLGFTATATLYSGFTSTYTELTRFKSSSLTLK